MAKLWADQIEAGVKTYDEVPRLLKDPVKALLIERGRTDLLPTEEPTV